MEIKTFGWANANIDKDYTSPVGWAAHQCDGQACEKGFSIMKEEGNYYISYLKPKQRSKENVIKCYQRAWEEVPQSVLNNLVLNFLEKYK